MTDVISLTGLRGYGYHGVYEDERRDGQEFVVDVTLELDTPRPRPATTSPTPCTTASLATALVDVVEGEPVKLLERLAQRLADRCLSDPRVAAVTVTVHKPQAPIPHEFADVAVTIRRTG